MHRVHSLVVWPKLVQGGGEIAAHLLVERWWVVKWDLMGAADKAFELE